jgi:hypothetical protein
MISAALIEVVSLQVSWFLSQLVGNLSFEIKRRLCHEMKLRMLCSISICAVMWVLRFVDNLSLD